MFCSPLGGVLMAVKLLGVEVLLMQICTALITSEHNNLHWVKVWCLKKLIFLKNRKVFFDSATHFGEVDDGRAPFTTELQLWWEKNVNVTTLGKRKKFLARAIYLSGSNKNYHELFRLSWELSPPVGSLLLVRGVTLAGRGFLSEEECDSL